QCHERIAVDDSMRSTYAIRGDSSWNSEVIASASARFVYLALLADGTPVAALDYGAGLQTTLWKRSAAGWQMFDSVSPNILVPHGLATDAAGNLHTIGTAAGMTGPVPLVYGRKSSTWTFTTVDQLLNVGQMQLAVAPSGQAQIAYRQTYDATHYAVFWA